MTESDGINDAEFSLWKEEAALAVKVLQNLKKDEKLSESSLSSVSDRIVKNRQESQG